MDLGPMQPVSTVRPNPVNTILAMNRIIVGSSPREITIAPGRLAAFNIPRGIIPDGPDGSTGEHGALGSLYGNQGFWLLPAVDGKMAR